jgi:hypothetical protein
VVDDRGQALSFEGIAAGIILLSAVGFALQVTAVTPLSPSTSSQHVENQIQSTSEGALDSAGERGALADSVLYWNDSTGTFHSASPDVEHYQGVPSGGLAISDTLNRTFADRNVAYNLRIQYHTAEGLETQQFVEQGRPSDHAVTASRTLVLHESDRLVEADNSEGARLGDPGTGFYAPNLDTDESMYNILHVKVVAWRI